MASLVFNVTGVTRHPAADDRLMHLRQGIKALPQIAIFQIPFVPARPGSPALGIALRQPAQNKRHTCPWNRHHLTLPYSPGCAVADDDRDQLPEISRVGESLSDDIEESLDWHVVEGILDVFEYKEHSS